MSAKVSLRSRTKGRKRFSCVSKSLNSASSRNVWWLPGYTGISKSIVLWIVLKKLSLLRTRDLLTRNWTKSLSTWLHCCQRLAAGVALAAHCLHASHTQDTVLWIKKRHTHIATLTLLALQLSHLSCNNKSNYSYTRLTHTFAFNMFLQFADLSANWKRHQSRFLSLSLSHFSNSHTVFHRSLSHTHTHTQRVHQLAIQAEFREMFFDVYALRIRHVARAFNSVCLSVGKQVSILFD